MHNRPAQLSRLRITVWRLMATIAVLALVCGAATCVQREFQNRLVVENRSGQALVRLTISLPNSGQTMTFHDLPDREAATAVFQIKGDDSFDLRGVLADGSTVTGNFGYVTNGLYGEHPQFVVRTGGSVDFAQ